MEAHTPPNLSKQTPGLAVLITLLSVAGLTATVLSEKQAEEAVIATMRTSDQWSFYQAKSIKSTILSVNNPNNNEVLRYAQEMKEIRAHAESLEQESFTHFQKRGLLVYALILFQIASGLLGFSSGKRGIILLSSTLMSAGALVMLYTLFFLH